MIFVHSLTRAYKDCRNLVKGSKTLKNTNTNKYIFVMCEEPMPDLTIEKANQIFDEIETEKDIADLFAIVHNKAWWIEDEEYDFEAGTEEHKKAAERTDMWFALSDKLRNMIFNILKSEGVDIPEKGQIVVLEPFMKRNGFIDGSGWWIKE